MAEKKNPESAGQNAEAKNAAAGNANDENKKNEAAAKVKMTVRHKSTTQNYFRAGLRFTKTFAEYEVPADKVDTIKADKWLEVKEGK